MSAILGLYPPTTARSNDRPGVPPARGPTPRGAVRGDSRSGGGIGSLARRVYGVPLGFSRSSSRRRTARRGGGGTGASGAPRSVRGGVMLIVVLREPYRASPRRAGRETDGSRPEIAPLRWGAPRAPAPSSPRRAVRPRRDDPERPRGAPPRKQ